MAKKLKGGEHMTVPLDHYFGKSGLLTFDTKKVISADIVVWVHYRLLFLRFDKQQTFELVRDNVANAVWRARPDHNNLPQEI